MNIFDLDWQQQLIVVLTVVVAAILGGAVGMEREMADRPAGLRTHALLAAAACLLVGLTDTMIGRFSVDTASSVLRVDPIRVVEAIVTGTAFLGAGTIFRHRGGSEVEGLTTAASLFLVAGIGIAVGLRQIVLALSISVLALVLLRVVAKLKVDKSEDH